jgi:hypothetical protein
MDSSAHRIPVLSMRVFTRHSMPICPFKTAFCVPTNVTIAAIRQRLVGHNLGR